jgi:hypothetical protein
MSDSTANEDRCSGGAPEPVDAAEDAVLGSAVDVLRQPVELRSGFTERVMAGVLASGRPTGGAAIRVRAVLRWATERHTVRLSPLGGLALAAGVAALLAGGVWAGRESMLRSGAASRRPGELAARPAPAPASRGGGCTVRFAVAAPGASQVTLVGDFNEWNPAATPLAASAHGGIWSVTIPLPPGRHEYAFVVDREHWLPDPRAPRALSDDFGTPNSVVTVTERS